MPAESPGTSLSFTLNEPYKYDCLLWNCAPASGVNESWTLLLASSTTTFCCDQTIEKLSEKEADTDKHDPRSMIAANNTESEPEFIFIMFQDPKLSRSKQGSLWSLTQVKWIPAKFLEIRLQSQSLTLERIETGVICPRISSRLDLYNRRAERSSDDRRGGLGSMHNLNVKVVGQFHVQIEA